MLFPSTLKITSKKDTYWIQLPACLPEACACVSTDGKADSKVWVPGHGSTIIQDGEGTRHEEQPDTSNVPVGQVSGAGARSGYPGNTLPGPRLASTIVGHLQCKIWLLGHSFIRRAADRAKIRPGGQQMGFLEEQAKEQVSKTYEELNMFKPSPSPALTPLLLRPPESQ
ncbi:uncharacterized protein LOC121397210 isoform X2 [Xenopus laevis]|uniref:Uncharacterized protein LOC121397210 isoform X2 n=1 Tax=Xenopus laevis TaxID=8355 RepID=A0A8J1LIW6_XENLA|nr:uncharacterized protein LOC121397210 isoform X2 [Xenopus laevis]